MLIDGQTTIAKGNSGLAIYPPCHPSYVWDFFAQQFPEDKAEDYELAEDESATRLPLNFGEAIIVLPGTEANKN